MQKNLLLNALIVGAFFVNTPSNSQLFMRQEPCDYPALFEHARSLVAKIPVEHSQANASYTETRVYRRGTEPRHGSDFRERTIPLALINTSTCEIVPTTVTRRIERGRVPMALMSNDARFLLALEHRAYGTLWNGFNTPLHVVAPEGWIVGALHWKSYTKGNSIVYTPESADLVRAFPNIPIDGRAHFRHDEQHAITMLRNVPSDAVPGMSVADVHERFFPRLLESIVTIEQADDFQLEEYNEGRALVNPLDRAFTVIGANPEKAFAYTVSSAGARGKMQIMPDTCADMRRLYQEARIPVGCFAEDHGHPAELAAAMLVVDHHLMILRSRLMRKDETPEQFAARKDMPMLLRASYNTGPGRVAQAVRAQNNWQSLLLAETKGYLLKSLGFDGAVTP